MTPFFLPTPAGHRLFCVYHPAQGEARGRVLLLPPWGEEMHRARRALARTAREFAAKGYAVLAFDPFGTGDSEGDFGDATLSIWREDCLAALDWLARATTGPLTLFALRSGALLACLVYEELPEAALLLWHPEVSGKAFLTHLLRLKLAGDLRDAPDASLRTAPLRESILAGQSLEIAGYLHSGRMAAELEVVRLQPLEGSSRQVAWFELVSRDPVALTPAAQRQVELWRGAGAVVRAEAFSGPRFWQTAELEDAPPALVAASLSWLETL